MNRLVKGICCSVIILVFFTGCKMDIKEIQNLNYATAIGVDYKDGKYNIYIQMVDFNSVAKTEGGVTSPQVLVSESTGSTFIDAFFEVYQTGQTRFVWAHISAILLSEAALQEGFEHIYDGITRYYEFRLTPWIFATKEPLEDVLSTFGFFNQSALETLLHNPMRIHEQSSMVRPIKLHEFAREVFEPGRTTYVPSLAINDTQWSKNNENEVKLALEGAYFIQNKQYKGFYTLEQLAGLRWLEPDTMRASILVPDKEKPDFLAVIENPKTEVVLKRHNEKFQFDVVMDAEGSVGNLLSLDHLQEMEKKTEESIREQMKGLYELGVENETDFFNIEHQLYREHNKNWKDVTELFEEVTLADITVDISLLHGGAFKNK
ncbi:Ger(x)C family spore germination protein [Bacillus sp. FJAT-45350]|uniref:Ger(x)C family spore germination protein n=1 Tax=Bacillus sp. FJAT-45350 TaxID=2011014 RepID=UPI000BB7941B|nr:Ger(x)C family spore germination protein [Bacillus sp. FJAT-45350]